MELILNDKDWQAISLNGKESMVVSLSYDEDATVIWSDVNTSSSGTILGHEGGIFDYDIYVRNTSNNQAPVSINIVRS